MKTTLPLIVILLFFLRLSFIKTVFCGQPVNKRPACVELEHAGLPTWYVGRQDVIEDYFFASS